VLRKQQTAAATIMEYRERSFSSDGELSPSSSSDDTPIGAPPRKTLKPLPARKPVGRSGAGPGPPPDDLSDRSMSLNSAGDNFSEFSRGASDASRLTSWRDSDTDR